MMHYLSTRTSLRSSISSEIPDAVCLDKLLKAIQDPETIIYSQADIADMEEVLDDKGVASAYRVFKDVPHYGRVTFTTTIENTPTGISSRVRDLPLGVLMNVKIHIIGSDSPNPRKNAVLTDECELSGHILLMPVLMFSKYQFLNAHRGMHASLFDTCKKAKP